MFGLTGGVIVQGGAVGLLFAVAWLLFTGRLLSRKQVEDLVTVHKQRAEDFKEAISRVDARNDELAKQLAILIPLAETSARALEAIRAHSQDKEPA